MVRFIAILIVILPGCMAGAQDARLMILHDHGNPVVSEMVRLRIRGEYDLTISLEDMQFPDSPEYDWVQTARDDWHKERVNGRLLQIFERQIAVFPRRAGRLHIGPVHHDLTYVTADGGRAEISVPAPQTTLNVQPFPADHSPLAARSLTLTDQLSAEPGQLKQDEVLTRKVTIEALGTLPHYLPPRPDLRQPWMISFTAPEIRESILTSEGPVARVEWEWQLRPHTGEPAILPGFGFPWFDTMSRQIEVAPMKPIPFGLAGFGANFGAAEAPGFRNAWLVVVPLLSFLISLTLLIYRFRPHSMAAWLRRLLPSPHIAAMKTAAARNDLPALRRAIDLHETRTGMHHDTSALDRQLFGASPMTQFDAGVWLRSYLGANRRARRNPPDS
ncbi:hypothetical protein PAF17_06730 [Paracoccus sp. Z330]|uniref:Protein BatD n=1 Tax=Paracoccus onchidii TaxID=3017813 RepID=A0ABT4ZCW4_9RHOB|nr:hypothetical protein [Paracoccus onchidii]MDB6177202.1 hypothetical protein [Paracoccus onchidii]